MYQLTGAIVDEAAIGRKLTVYAEEQVDGWLGQLEDILLALYDAPKTGRPGRFRQASAPGEPPARQSGQLAGSFERLPFTNLSTGLRLADEKASWLDEGTGRIAPRPFTQRAKASLLEQITQGGSFQVTA